MKILIVGCGYVGERVADALHAVGHEVVGVTHSPESAQRLATAKAWRAVACNISDLEAVNALKTEVGAVDAWLHCASSGRGGAEAYQAVYVKGVSHLLEVFPEAHGCFTSSTSVYPQTDGSMVNEQSPAEPDRETGRLLRQAEEMILAAGGSVARLGGIYGPERSFVLKHLLEGSAGVEEIPEAPEGRYLNQIHRDDAAQALVHLVLQKLKGIYNVVDDEPTTQQRCLTQLSEIMGMPSPGNKPLDVNRKRGWTHKQVSNAKLRTAGWIPRFPNYVSAVHQDPDLVSSILAIVLTENQVPLPRAENVVLIGLMGSGKTSVGRHVAGMLGFQLVDTDALIIEAAGKSIPDIFAEEGEAGFRVRESAALRSLLGKIHCVIATGGGIVTQKRNHSLLRHLGYIVWLEAEPKLLARRTATSHDRPLLRGEEPPLQKLERLLEERGPLYKGLADLRIQTDDLTQVESAYGVAESARVQFAHMRTGH